MQCNVMRCNTIKIYTDIPTFKLLPAREERGGECWVVIPTNHELQPHNYPTPHRSSLWTFFTSAVGITKFYMTLLCCKLSSWLTNLTLAIQASSPWRNWLARSTVNREVGSSSLPGEEIVSAIFFSPSSSGNAHYVNR